MAMAGLYRRILPSPPAIDFASAEGKKLFMEANHSGTMEGFFRLISSFQTQSEPAYCGLASLSMVLNALGIDPGRKWKGPWRWFDESMLDCCEPLEKVKDKGISFGKVVCLAHCAGANVEAFRTNQITLNDFRKYVMACSRSDDCHVISSYDRGTFNQTGTGHFSPIGGYHAERDMTLILDVARFKYPPHWVPLTLLWEAMGTVDEATGLQRGFMLVSRRQSSPALLYTLTCKHESWKTTAQYLMVDVPVLLSSDSMKDVKNVLSSVLMSLPLDFTEFIKWAAEIRRKENNGQGLSEEEKGKLAIKEELLKQVQETDLYKHVTDILSPDMKQISNLQESLPNVAANICCQGAGLFTGNFGSADSFCSREKSVRGYRSTNFEKPIPIVSETVVNGSTGEAGVDAVVPSSQTESSCCNFSSCNYSAVNPESNDILTALLLALPTETWSSIKDKEVLQEIRSLVSIDSLPPLLQEEILHLRGHLLLYERCKDGKVEDARGTSQGMNSIRSEAKLLQRLNFNSNQNVHENSPGLSTLCSVSKPFLPHRGIVFSLGQGRSWKEHSLQGKSWNGIRSMIACPKSTLNNTLGTFLRHPGH